MSAKDEVFVVEKRDISWLKPYEHNAKIHTEEHIDKLAKLIKANGWVGNPIVATEKGEIIAGHGRRLAALKIGLKLVPVHIVTGKTKAEIAAMRLSDNASTSSEYDDDKIKFALEELAAMDFDMGLTGYSEPDIARFMVSSEDLDSLISGLEPSKEEQKPDSPAKPATSEPPTGDNGVPQEIEHQFYVMVTVKTEMEQRKLYERLTEEGFACRLMSQ